MIDGYYVIEPLGPRTKLLVRVTQHDDIAFMETETQALEMPVSQFMSMCRSYVTSADRAWCQARKVLNDRVQPTIFGRA